MFLMKCDYCGQKFEKGGVEKIIRGERHIFCTECCYVLYHYKMPVLDMTNILGIRGRRLSSVPDFRQLALSMTEEEEDEIRRSSR